MKYLIEFILTLIIVASIIGFVSLRRRQLKSEASVNKLTDSKRLRSQRRSALKTLLLGTIAIFIALQFSYWWIGDPFSDLLLLQSGVTTSGFITNTWEDFGGYEGGSRSSYDVVYTYDVNDHNYVKKYSRSGRLKSKFQDLKEPYPIEIEYLPKHPYISRLKGSGAQSLLEWFFRKLILSLFIYGAFLTPGVTVAKNGYEELRKVNDGLFAE